ncbi:MAG TPA: SIS domain-containing protein [Armatimonadota bacterium]|nr:SIS domain-containing protein [Armatimonadota bacterium]HQK95876.1 SIS domain-containing protein [Armatimonadota bacterium]
MRDERASAPTGMPAPTRAGEAMSAERYIEKVQTSIQLVLETQREPIAEAARILVTAIRDGKRLYSFGCSHSFILTEELVYRTGGLMLVNPIYPHGMNLSVRPMTMTSQLERLEGLGNILLRNSGAGQGDALLLASTSGRNAVAIDMALEAKARGVSVIGITSMAYSRSVSSRHSSGKKLYEIADVILDNCVPAGDAAVQFEGFAQAVGPLSTVTGVAIVNALVCQVVQELIEAGVTPPVFVSANLDGGDEHNARLLAENADRILYM